MVKILIGNENDVWEKVLNPSVFSYPQFKDPKLMGDISSEHSSYVSKFVFEPKEFKQLLFSSISRCLLGELHELPIFLERIW